MALLDGFLTPLGFAALAAAIPLILLYLIRPNPVRYRLPTMRFLTKEGRQAASNPLFERLRRSLLLLLQLLVLLLLATSLASPYVLVPEEETVRETVVVLDTSASMATETGSGTRFGAARGAATDLVSDRTSLVTTHSGARVALRGGDPGTARDAIAGASVTAAPGDLASAVATAQSIAGKEARIVVLSDFADGTAWRDAVAAARAAGLRVDLRQFGGGGGDNVGIVERSFSGSEVTITVKNYGAEPATRTLSLGTQRAELTLQPGDLATRTFGVPAGGGQARLSPGDSFPLDDTFYLAAPEQPTVDVLVLTNDRNEFLLTALEVNEAIDLTVDSPPTTIGADHDVVIFSNVDQGRLLQSTLETTRDIVADGGGAAVQAQPSMPQGYRDLLLLRPGSVVEESGSIETVASHELTAGISFPPPDSYVSGSLAAGSPLVTLTDDTALLAVHQRDDGGRLLYYGYIEEASAFKYNYQYPVFWKRAVFYLAGREPLPDRNRRTGDVLQFPVETQVRTPSGTVTARSIPLDDTGFYVSEDRQVSASLLSEAESNVAPPDVGGEGGDGPGAGETETRRVPRELTPLVAAAALLFALVEIAYLRRRGDL